MAKYVYPAVFSPEEGGYSVFFRICKDVILAEMICRMQL